MLATEKQYLIDIHGSCVSRAIFLNGNLEATGCADPRMQINYYFDKHPILSCMTPVPHTNVLNESSIEKISEKELWDKSERNLRGLKQELLKSTRPLIKKSEADFFVFDLYDFHTNLMMYDDTIFSPYKYEFFNTNLYKNNVSEFTQMIFPLDLPLGLWWGYIELFFDEVFEKYGQDRVILVRFKACSYYVSKEKKVCPIPENFVRPWMANAKYNNKIRELEERIIEKYHPHVLDLSKYYIGDQKYNSDLQGAHFSKEYYMESFEKIKEIVFAIPRGVPNC